MIGSGRKFASRLPSIFLWAPILVILIILQSSNLWDGLRGNLGMRELNYSLFKLPNPSPASELNNAREYISATYSNSSQNPQWGLNLSRVEIESGNWGEARDLLLEAQKNAPKNVLIAYYLGIVYTALRDWQSAVNPWTTAGAYGKLLDLAAEVQSKTSLQEALPFFEAAVRANPSSALAWRELGIAKYHVHTDLTGAASAFRTAITLDPKDSAAAQGLGAIYIETGDYDQALQLASWMEQQFFAQAFSPILYGDIYKAMGRFPEAESAYLLAIVRDPTLVGAHERLADTYERWGKDDFAQREWQAALLIQPNRWDFHIRLAQNYQRLGQWQLALDEFRKAQELTPEDMGLKQIIQDLSKKVNP